MVVNDGSIQDKSEGIKEEEMVKEEVVDPLFDVIEGDIFLYENEVVGLVILSIMQNIDGVKHYKVRKFNGSNNPIIISDEKLAEHLQLEGLRKLKSYCDMMTEITDLMVLNEGDFFTNGEKTIATILTDSFVYTSPNGENSSVIGCSIYGKVGTYRDMFELKVFLYEHADQFEQQRNQ
ncbi:MAG: hypothetical protein WCW84_13505 [Sulfurimonas sp.]